MKKPRRLGAGRGFRDRRFFGAGMRPYYFFKSSWIAAGTAKTLSAIAAL